MWRRELLAFSISNVMVFRVGDCCLVLRSVTRCFTILWLLALFIPSWGLIGFKPVTLSIFSFSPTQLFWLNLLLTVADLVFYHTIISNFEDSTLVSVTLLLVNLKNYLVYSLLWYPCTVPAYEEPTSNSTFYLGLTLLILQLRSYK